MNTSASIDHAAEALVARSRGLRVSSRNSQPRQPAAGRPRQPVNENITIQHVLIAARRREAPVSVETAGYIALAVADAMVAVPAVLRTNHVHLTAEGLVSIAGADGSGTDTQAEQCVRSLLGRLLAVAVGSSPALASCAKRRAGQGTGMLVRELEAALIPANRSAARRSIARLARETGRAAPDVTNPTRPLAPPAVKASRKALPRTKEAAPPAPTPKSFTPTPMEPAFRRALRERAAAPPPAPIPVPDITDVDDVIVVSASPSPARVAETFEAEASSSDTPRLATYDPHAGTSTAPPAEVFEQEEEDAVDMHAFLATSFDDGDDCDLLTYLPPDVEDGDAGLDFGTASPPAVAAQAADEEAGSAVATDAGEGEAEPAMAAQAAEEEAGSAVAADAVEDEAEPAMAVQPVEEEAGSAVATDPVEREAECAVVAGVEAAASDDVQDAPSAPEGDAVTEGVASEPPGEVSAEGLAQLDAAKAPVTPRKATRVSRPDSQRVNELLASFGGTTTRSAREVAGDLKALVGLPPTPPPPAVDPNASGAEGAGEGSVPEPSDPPAAMAPVELARPRNPKLTLALSMVLLVLAILGIVAVYFAFPQLLIGH